MGNVAADRNSCVLSHVGTPVMPGDDDLGSLPTVDTSGANFRWVARRYFLTWVQVGDTPNDYCSGSGSTTKCCYGCVGVV